LERPQFPFAYNRQSVATRCRRCSIAFEAFRPRKTNPNESISPQLPGATDLRRLSTPRRKRSRLKFASAPPNRVQLSPFVNVRTGRRDANVHPRDTPPCVEIIASPPRDIESGAGFRTVRCNGDFRTTDSPFSVFGSGTGIRRLPALVFIFVLPGAPRGRSLSPVRRSLSAPIRLFDRR
jgi:hypothetical protein